MVQTCNSRRRKTKSKHTRVFPRFQSKSRKLGESTLISITSIEPLEERPKETEWEEFQETMDLLPVKNVNKFYLNCIYCLTWKIQLTQNKSRFILGHLISFRSMEPINKNSCSSSSWISQFVVYDHHLLNNTQCIRQQHKSSYSQSQPNLSKLRFSSYLH